MSDAIDREAMSQAGPRDQYAATPAVERRPGLVTFAGIMLLLLAGLEATWALVQFFNATWFATNVYGDFGGYLWLWGILDGLLALVALYAGFDVLRGGTLGQIIGIVIAAFGTMRWFFYLPAAPWIAAVVIAVDVLIVYGLVAHSDYFNTTRNMYQGHVLLTQPGDHSGRRSRANPIGLPRQSPASPWSACAGRRALAVTPGNSVLAT